jgi:hypothetical protein
MNTHDVETNQLDACGHTKEEEFYFWPQGLCGCLRSLKRNKKKFASQCSLDCKQASVPKIPRILLAAAIQPGGWICARS